MNEFGAADLGLFWLSTKSTVSDGRLRNLARRLSPDEASTKFYWSLAHSLQVLGHIEWSDASRHWAVLSPYCIELTDQGFLHCGARLPGWRATLQDNLDLEIEEQYRGRGPQRWLTETAPETDQGLEIPVLPERGAELLASLPHLDSVIERFPDFPLPAGNKWESLTPSGEWKAEPALVLPEGLYRNREYTHSDHLLKTQAGFFRVRSREEKALAWWWQQTKQRRIKLVYDRSREGLLIPHIKGGRLPLVLERALCACSGRLPLPDGRKLHWAYPRVDLPRARNLARILQCKLEVS